MRKLLVLSIALLMVCTSIGISYSDLNDGLMAYYPFNGNTNDESGNGNHLTAYGALMANDRFDNPNGAYFFDGVDDFMKSIAKNWGFDTTATVCAWIKTDSIGAIVSLSHDYVQDEMLLASDWLGRMAIVNHKAYSDFNIRYINTSLNDSNWHFVVGQLNGGGQCDNLHLFVDGTERIGSCIANHPDIVDTTPRTLRIGARTDDGFSSFKGVIDDIRIYDRVLSRDEILKLFGATKISKNFLLNDFNNHLYNRVQTEKTWDQAELYCEALGGHLATLTSQLENDIVYSTLCNDGTGYWLGGTDELVEGTWEWISGEPWDYTNWASGNPDDYQAGQDYLAFWYMEPNTWDDDGPPREDTTRNFICEWDNLDDFANIIRRTDIDHDNDVDGRDLYFFSRAFGSIAGSPNYNPDADFDEDGDVDELNLIAFSYMYGESDLGIFLTDMATLPYIPDHNLSITDELNTEYTPHESVYARIMNLQLNLVTPEDDTDHFMRNYANPDGAGIEPSGKTLITYLLDNAWSDELNIDSSFNTVYSNSPGPDEGGVFEVVSVSDDAGSIRGTNNTHAYYFSYDALNDWNNSAITINQWVNYLESIKNIYGSIGRLTIFVHGNRGYLHMSDSFVLTTDKLQNDSNIRNELNRLTQILSEDSHILLFSCKVAKDGLLDNKGSEFIQELANLTGATVHANRDYTGNYDNSWFGSDTDWSLDAVAVPSN